MQTYTSDDAAGEAADITANAGMSHFDSSGQAHMVDIANKPDTARRAIANGKIYMQTTTLAAILQGNSKKGDVLGIARIAGIQASKRASELIPLCHPLSLSRVSLSFIHSAEEAKSQSGAQQVWVACTVTAETVGKTGVEMEALTAVSVALLTIYDMCKAIDRGMTLGEIQLCEKSGGNSGDWKRA